MFIRVASMPKLSPAFRVSPSCISCPDLPNLISITFAAIKPGDEVITVAAGFPTTVNPMIQFGCVPVFVDVHIPTYNIDVNRLEEALSPKTKAIMLAHTLGNPFNLKVVMDFARLHPCRTICLIQDGDSVAI